MTSQSMGAPQSSISMQEGLAWHVVAGLVEVATAGPFTEAKLGMENACHMGYVVSTRARHSRVGAPCLLSRLPTAVQLQPVMENGWALHYIPPTQASRSRSTSTRTN